ncbi:MAG: dihydrofolate synthase/folylpolyglutamate synthase [bacterium]
MDTIETQFLFELGNFGIKFGLENIQNILQLLDNPHKNLQVIHLAGTNGKGSTLITLEKLFIDSGFTVGSTISPHLVHFNERFRIQGQSISDEDLDWAFRKICTACSIDPHNPHPELWKVKPTFFEFSIAIAFLLFQKHQVDYVLLETGMGGRLDATNVIDHPLACIITHIAKDHEGFLGNTLEKIAYEKLGIVKKGSPVFVAKQKDNLEETIKNYCSEKTTLYFDQSNFFFHNTEQDENKFVFKYNQELITFPIAELALEGAHQWDNTATALAVYSYLIPKNRYLTAIQIQQSLLQCSWAGRLEYLDQEKKILLDAAHNATAMQALVHFLKTHYRNKKIIIAIAWMKDKEFLTELNLFSSLDVTFQPLSIEFDRFLPSKQIYQQLTNQFNHVNSAEDIEQFVSRLKNQEFHEFDLVLVTGSLHLIGEVMRLWR